jgi:hypothetical protein
MTRSFVLQTPAECLVQQRLFQFLQRGFISAVLLKSVEVFEKEQPGGLFGVIEFGSTAGFFRRASSTFLNACSNMAACLP